ncbi:hypothetical protein VPDG_00076 [Vibrio phage henriette 12B8]|uniref:HNH endonuclease n=1 Tax=Vibrio phage henriette 12B8 TaxID=573174 RepID=UPI0002C15665|nr:HNH endonuclease [Vibrio phage henriette 12B8]AGG58237.1 hypothetical protein VPDG_00076 [Vibrio phage henriette 12B8]
MGDVGIVYDYIGRVVGCLTVIGKTKVRGRMMWECKCVCENVRYIPTNTLNSYKYTHCRCSGEHNTRLHECWRNMKVRSKIRTSKGEQCDIDAEWLVFINFRDWALCNGYTDDKILCRNGDVGGYNPNNCRWDTIESNNIEGHAIDWKFISPDGNVVLVYNLAKFCRENNLTYHSMQRINKGTRKSHKGWTKYDGDRCKSK